jgi:hypothetical protein
VREGEDSVTKALGEVGRNRAAVHAQLLRDAFGRAALAHNVASALDADAVDAGEVVAATKSASGNKHALGEA